MAKNLFRKAKPMASFMFCLDRAELSGATGCGRRFRRRQGHQVAPEPDRDHPFGDLLRVQESVLLQNFGKWGTALAGKARGEDAGAWLKARLARMAG